MNIERGEQNQEIKKLGNIEIKKSPDGKILRINEISLQPEDKIIVVQRHQKAAPYTKEDLLANAGEGKKNMDFIWDPSATDEGAERELILLNEIEQNLGKMDLIAATPRKRGIRDKKLLNEKFPEARQNENIDELLDDGELGLVGDSYFGSYEYDIEESRKYFRPNATIPWKFPPMNYFEAWVNLGYRSKNSRYKVESPEELTQRTSTLLDQLDGEKNYVVTHEANCVTFHMLAQRTPEQLRELLNQIEIPGETRSVIEPKLEGAANFLDLYKLVKQSLTKYPVKGCDYKKVLISILENTKLKSGTRGYGAVSIYISRKNEEGKKILLEPVYDIQLKESPK